MKPLVVITGASSGIGAATAKTLSEAGHPLLLVSRRLERMESLKLPNSLARSVKGARMSWYYWVGFVIGIYMIWGGATKSSAKPYFFLHARASLLWKQQAHTFLMISGIAVCLVMLFLALTR